LTTFRRPDLGRNANTATHAKIPKSKTANNSIDLTQTITTITRPPQPRFPNAPPTPDR
jgi:hypothetical protein